MRQKALPSLLSAALLLMGCTSSNESSICDELSSTFTFHDRMGQSVTTFTAGEPITFRGQITNSSDSPKTFTIGGCGPVLFETRNTAGESIWGDHDQLVCPAVISEVTYAPGETKTFSRQWDQRQRNGVQTPEGQYTGHLIDVTECSESLSKSRVLTIQ